MAHIGTIMLLFRRGGHKTVARAYGHDRAPAVAEPVSQGAGADRPSGSSTTLPCAGPTLLIA
jgi:hypothetical protein